MKEEDDLREFKLLQIINFSYVILTAKTDITKKMLKSYITEITPKYIQGFTKVKSPILYSEFLRKVLELHKWSTLKDFSVLVPKEKFYKDLVNQITETGSIIHPKTGLVQVSDLVTRIGEFIRKIYVQDRSKYALIAQNYANLSSSLRDLNSDDDQAIEESSSQICKQIGKWLLNFIEDMNAKEISTYLSKRLSQIL